MLWSEIHIVAAMRHILCIWTLSVATRAVVDGLLQSVVIWLVWLHISTEPYRNSCVTAISLQQGTAHWAVCLPCRVGSCLRSRAMISCYASNHLMGYVICQPPPASSALVERRDASNPGMMTVHHALFLMDIIDYGFDLYKKLDLVVLYMTSMYFRRL